MNPTSYKSSQSNRTLSEFFTPADSPHIIDEASLIKKMSKTHLAEYRQLSANIDHLKADLSRMARFSESAKENTRQRLQELKSRLQDIKDKYSGCGKQPN
jgi:hypothetical protein